MSSIALLLMKASALLAVAILVARTIRGSAVRRHAFWSGAFAALLLLPFLGAVLPSIDVKVPQPTGIALLSAPATPMLETSASAPDALTQTVVVDQFKPTNTAAAWHLPTLSEALIAIWLAGVVIAIGSLVVSLVRVMRLTKRGSAITDRAWRDAADRIAREFGIAGVVRLVVDHSVVTPMAAGIRTPTIFLPATAGEWTADRRDVVLAHEMAHLASRDPVRHLVSRVAVTLYWFHPLAWLASREATTACEQACDEAVLSLGVRPSAYAEILLDFASGARTGAPAAALPIVRRKLLETRLMAILDHTPRRDRSRVIIPAVLGVGLTLSIAAIRPSASRAVAPNSSSDAESPAPAPIVTAEKPKAGATAVGTAKPAAKPTGGSQSVAAPLVVDCERGSWQGDFSGSMTNSRGNGVVDRVVQRRYSDVRLCMAGERMSKGESRPSEWAGQADRLILETEERSGDVRRMETDRGVTTYSVNGRAAPIDANVQEWRRALIGAMDAIWEVNQLHGQVNSLRGEINSIQGERNSLLGEINSLQGEVNSMQGEINSVRGQENSLRGEINSINGQLNSMQGQINSERGAINSLQSARYDRLADRDAIDARIRQHEQNIRRIEDDIVTYNADRRVRDVERRIADFDADGKVAEIERRIRDFDLEGKTAAVRRRIAQLDVEGQVGSIERDIQGLHEGDRTIELERRADQALQALRARLRR